MRQTIFILLLGIYAPAFAQDEIKLILTYGQSLSTGVTNAALANVSDVADYPNEVITLDSGSNIRNSVGWEAARAQASQIVGFTSFTQKYSWRENPAAGALNTIAANYEADAFSIPTLLSISAGAGGRSIADLSVKDKDFYPDLSSGLSATLEGDTFYILNPSSSKYEYYLKHNNAAVRVPNYSLSATQKPPYYENMLTQVSRAKSLANAQGKSIHPKVYMIWQQGQADASNQHYEHMLGRLIDNIENDLKVILGPTYSLNVSIGQLRGNPLRGIAIEQINLAEKKSNVFVGAVVTQINLKYGDNPNSTTSTHLSKIGYRILGEMHGHSIYDHIRGRTPPLPLISSIEVNGLTVTVNFDGLRGGLMEDTSMHQQAGINPPPHFGFYIYNGNGHLSGAPKILASQILPPNQVELTLDKAITSSVNFYLGKNEAKVNSSPNSTYSGTTLADSITDPFRSEARTGALYFGQNLPRFAPTQHFILNPNQQTTPGYVNLIGEASPNSPIKLRVR